MPYQRTILFIGLLAAFKSCGTPSQGGVIITAIIGAILYTYDRRELSRLP